MAGLAIAIIFEVSAFIEHIITMFNLCRYKLIAGVYGCESGAFKEHTIHIRHIRSIEVSKVERGET